jgi:glucose-1-phosphate cytidylyltransferase
MKVVILAGGLGTRISEYTKSIPKPMIRIKKLPILVHIMKHYAKYGFSEFYIALGYKGNIIKNYFKKKKFNWKVNLINTGKNTMTGGRLKRLKKYLYKENFFLTYGDGLSNVNLAKLLKFSGGGSTSLILTLGPTPKCA